MHSSRPTDGIGIFVFYEELLLRRAKQGYGGNMKTCEEQAGGAPAEVRAQELSGGAGLRERL
jgi:hypothetical protein